MHILYTKAHHLLPAINDPHHSFETIVARGYSSHGIVLAQITRNTLIDVREMAVKGPAQREAGQGIRVGTICVLYIIQSIGI